MKNSTLATALDWAANGFHVFPLTPLSKHPYAHTQGFVEATTDPDEVAALWKRHGLNSNVGIAAGASGLVVVDVDCVEHEINERLARENPTLAQRTPRGGWHWIYLQPEGTPVRNVRKHDVIAKDVETRGEGGYFLVSPSTVKLDDGTIGEYSICSDMAPQPCPQWIVDVVRADVAQRNKPVVRPASMTAAEPWGRGRLAKIIQRLEATAKGGRNNELASAAAAAGRIVGGGHLAFSEAYGALLAVVEQWPMLSKSKSTIKRGLSFGAQRPVYPEADPHFFDVFDQAVTDFAERIDFDSLGDEPSTTTLIIDEGTKAAQVNDEADVKQWETINTVRALGGLCETFPAWVMRGAIYPQPGLTLAATVALGAVLASRRFLYRGVTSNLFAVSLARTATGKGRPQECLEDALRLAAPGLCGPGNIASAKAMWRQVKTAANAGHGIVYAIDEYGVQLESILQRKGGSGAETYGWLLKFATANAKTLTWGQSATDGGEIEEAVSPALTLFGSTTPESLHRALQGDALEDGYIGRHLWFAGLTTTPPKRRGAHHEPRGVPADVANAVREIFKAHQAWAMGGKTEVNPPPLEVGETEGAKAALDEWDDMVEEERHGRTDQVRAPEQILARATESVQRVALGLAVLRDPGAPPVIDEDVVWAATAIVDASCVTIGTSIQRDGARTQFERIRRQVERAVETAMRSTGQATAREVQRICRSLSSKDVGEVLARGRDEGLWDLRSITPPKGGRATVFVVPAGALPEPTED